MRSVLRALANRCASSTLLLVLTASAHPGALPAQLSDVVRAGPAPLLLGTPAEDRLRLSQLRDSTRSNGFYFRSASSLTPRLDTSGPALWFSPPSFGTGWNSDIPFSLNDGALWAGRGISLRGSIAVQGQWGLLSVMLAPEVAWMQNSAFPYVASRNPELSVFTSPWRVGQTSADLPVRFGTASYRQLDPGQSTLMLRSPRMAAGISTENQWWGPGIRSSIILSNNAPGFPHFFLRTEDPLRTRIGSFEGKWIVGALTESLFFDDELDNDLRSLSAVALIFNPAGEENLALGLLRSVYAGIDEGTGVFPNALDALTRWNQGSVDADTTARAPRTEQITSLFARWVFPSAGAEVYGEWARTEVPTSLRDFATAPYRSQGYTLGLQWTRDLFDRGILRLQSEATYLENSGKIGRRPTRGFYTSGRIAQGYTHRGQVLGAAIGPGSSSQWLAMDYLGESWWVGANASRIRWDDDSFYTRPNRDRHYAHDVSLIGGLRGGVNLRWGDFWMELARENRMNYQYQNDSYFFDTDSAVDVDNTILRLFFSPR